MKKCTLCVDRIYNENMPEESTPAGLRAGLSDPARHFGDLGDPESAVSKLVAERGGVALMPELGYAPVNQYLPQRARRGADADSHRRPRRSRSTEARLPSLLRWLDRALSR